MIYIISKFSNATPSHIFRVIFRCKDSYWMENEFQCEDAKSLDALAFVLPNVPDDYNCLVSYSQLFLTVI